MKPISLTILTVIIISLSACIQSNFKDEITDYNFISKWQSLNDPGYVVEFTEDVNYQIYREKNKIITLNYKINVLQGKKFKLDLIPEISECKTCRIEIEIVDQNRIRIISYKHHNILDEADEFYRTNDLESFREIMDSILKRHK